MLFIFHRREELYEYYLLKSRATRKIGLEGLNKNIINIEKKMCFKETKFKKKWQIIENL